MMEIEKGSNGLHSAEDLLYERLRNGRKTNYTMNELILAYFSTMLSLFPC
jgi:hypothetical protein